MDRVYPVQQVPYRAIARLNVTDGADRGIGARHRPPFLREAFSRRRSTKQLAQTLFICLRRARMGGSADCFGVRAEQGGKRERSSPGGVISSRCQCQERQTDAGRIRVPELRVSVRGLSRCGGRRWPRGMSRLRHVPRDPRAIPALRGGARGAFGGAHERVLGITPFDECRRALLRRAAAAMHREQGLCAPPVDDQASTSAWRFGSPPLSGLRCAGRRENPSAIC
jgi:hypothetical protein